MSLELGVLVSGTGSNLQAILNAIQAESLDARVRLVISNKPGVMALERAARAGVPQRCIPHTEFASREAFDRLRERLVHLGVSDGSVTEFPMIWSVRFVDPDGMEVELCWQEPALSAP